MSQKNSTAEYYAQMLETCEMVLTQVIADHTLEERTRARIHALTRRIKMLDSELEKLAEDALKEERRRPGYVLSTLKTIRDRYEEIGLFSPIKPAQK